MPENANDDFSSVTVIPDNSDDPLGNFTIIYIRAMLGLIQHLRCWTIGNIFENVS
jgi:hypothetical protein